MIVLDTHIWVWWVHGDAQLPATYQTYIQTQEAYGLGISAISCWEVAKLVEYGRLTLPVAVDDWLAQALAYPGIQLLELTPQIAVESTQFRIAFIATQPIRSLLRQHGSIAARLSPWIDKFVPILTYRSRREAINRRSAQHGIAVDRFAREIVCFLRGITSALAATKCQTVRREPSSQDHAVRFSEERVPSIHVRMT